MSRKGERHGNISPSPKIGLRDQRKPSGRNCLISIVIRWIVKRLKENIWDGKWEVCPWPAVTSTLRFEAGRIIIHPAVPLDIQGPRPWTLLPPESNWEPTSGCYKGHSVNIWCWNETLKHLTNSRQINVNTHTLLHMNRGYFIFQKGCC